MKIKENIYYIGQQDANLKVFDIIMETKYGTSYNAYVIKGSQKTAIVETVKLKFYEAYLEELEALVPISEIDYIIVNHTEPDHAGSISSILKLNPNITIVGSIGAIQFLKDIVNEPFNALIVKEGETITLGDKTLEFMMVPNLHWPDTMYTYVQEDKVLFTCDSFGAHYSSPLVLLSQIEDTTNYLEALKYYFDMIIKPFRNPFMVNALAKFAAKEVNLIATGHGPIIDCRIDEIISLYQTWCKPRVSDEKKRVVILYVSAYGYTELIAKQIVKNLDEHSHISCELINLEGVEQSMVLNQLEQADGILFGSPTILQEALPPIWAVLGQMNPIIFGKKVTGAFGSYGWSGEATTHISARLDQLKTKQIKSLKIKFKPSEADLLNINEFSDEFAKELL